MVDDEERGVVWSVAGRAMTHHHGAAQVFPARRAGRRFAWRPGLLPDDAAPHVEPMMEAGIDGVKPTLERLGHP